MLLNDTQRVQCSSSVFKALYSIHTRRGLIINGRAEICKIKLDGKDISHFSPFLLLIFQVFDISVFALQSLISRQIMTSGKKLAYVCEHCMYREIDSKVIPLMPKVINNLFSSICYNLLASIYILFRQYVKRSAYCRTPLRYKIALIVYILLFIYNCLKS